MPTSQCRGTQIFWYFRSPSANHRYVPGGYSCFINIPALAPLYLVTCCKCVRRFRSHRKVSSPEGNNRIWPAIVSYRKQSSHQTDKVSRIPRAWFLHQLGSDGHILRITQADNLHASQDPRNNPPLFLPFTRHCYRCDTMQECYQM